MQFHRLAHDIAQHLAGQRTIHHFQTVRQPMVDMPFGGETVNDLMESPGHDADLPTMTVKLVDQRQRAIGEVQLVVHGVEHAHGQSLEQCDTLTQRITEFDFPAHGTFGDLRYLVAAAGRLAELVDDFLVDQRGIHIHDKQTRLRQRRRGRGAVTVTHGVRGRLVRGRERLHVGHVIRFVRRLQSFVKHTVDCRKSLGQYPVCMNPCAYRPSRPLRCTERATPAPLSAPLPRSLWPSRPRRFAGRVI